jgi:hypothetical protein
MNLKILIITTLVIGIGGITSCAETTTANPQVDANKGAVDSTSDKGNPPAKNLPGQGGQESSPQVDNILDGLQKAAAGLKSYQCKVEYLFSQPVLESKTLRTGDLLYARFGNGSKLRINFNTLSQDDGPQQNYKESYIFDGLWLTHIDYQIKQVQKRQKDFSHNRLRQIRGFEQAVRRQSGRRAKSDYTPAPFGQTRFTVCRPV